MISRQYMRGLPYALKLKLFAAQPHSNPGNKMLSFTQRYRAIECYVLPTAHCSTSSIQSIASTTSETTAPTSSDPQLSQLVQAMVAGIAEKQLSLEDRLTKNEEQRNSNGNRPSGTCFSCGGLGHFAGYCRRSNARRKPSGNVDHLLVSPVVKLDILHETVANQAHFKLLRDGPDSGGKRDHPIVSNSGSDSCNITHPIVDCFVGEVRVRALLDTGSTKSIISNTVHQIIDFNGTAIKLVLRDPQCISISGHNLKHYWTD